MDFTKLFVDVDDFWKIFRIDYQRHLLATGVRKRQRQTRMSISEIMTILIAFQNSNYRTFKHFYLHLLTHHRHDFPDLVCYHRFVELMNRATLPLFAYLQIRCLGKVTGISFIDSTAIKVCNNKRIKRNRVFKGLAALGKGTMGWFFGFKLHLVINDRGELLAFAITPGNVDDRKPVPSLARGHFGGVVDALAHCGLLTDMPTTAFAWRPARCPAQVRLASISYLPRGGSKRRIGVRNGRSC